MKSRDDRPGMGEVVFNCLGLGACGGLLGGAVLGMILARGLSGVPCGLVAAIPGALVGTALGAPVTAVNRRLGWGVAACAGVLASAGLAWMLLDFMSGLAGG